MVLDQLTRHFHRELFTCGWNLEVVQSLLHLGQFRDGLDGFVQSLQCLHVFGVVLTIIGKQVIQLQGSGVTEGLALVLCQLHLVRGEGPAAVCITVHLDDGTLQTEVIGHLAGLPLKGIVVRSLHCNILLVVLPLVVKELLQDFGEGLNLVLWDALLELVRSTELLVELILRLLQQQCLILRGQGVLPGIEVVLEASHGHIAASSGGCVDEALTRQGTQHPGAQRQQHHREDTSRASHGVTSG
mmetsp:Transcript_2887/g.3255  ORF Transcript_2887/g.3255 Transcript_2887/m.3255 type:complete len:243 (-) Transcript_2887:66-794(-)